MKFPLRKILLIVALVSAILPVIMKSSFVKEKRKK